MVSVVPVWIEILGYVLDTHQNWRNGLEKIQNIFNITEQVQLIMTNYPLLDIPWPWYMRTFTDIYIFYIQYLVFLLQGCYGSFFRYIFECDPVTMEWPVKRWNWVWRPTVPLLQIVLRLADPSAPGAAHLLWYLCWPCINRSDDSSIHAIYSTDGAIGCSCCFGWPIPTQLLQFSN